MTFTWKRCEPTIAIDLQGLYASLSLSKVRYAHCTSAAQRIAPVRAPLHATRLSDDPLSVITVCCMLSLGVVMPSMVITTTPLLLRE